MTLHRLRGTRSAVAAVVLCACCAACGVPESRAEPIPRNELPESLRGAEPSTSAPRPPGEPAELAVYWVKDRRLVPESVSFGSSPDASRLVGVLERGPSSDSAGVRSAVSSQDVLAGVSVDGSSAAVDVGSAFGDLTASEQTLAVAQLVTTLTTVPGIESVAIRRDGEVADVPLPDGSLVRRPLVRSDYATLIG